MGWNVARLNFSHGGHEEHAARIQRIKKYVKVRVPCGDYVGYQGTEIRTGDLSAGKVELMAGEKVAIDHEIISGDEKRFSVSHENLPNEVSPGCRILIDDGLIQLETRRCF